MYKNLIAFSNGNSKIFETFDLTLSQDILNSIFLNIWVDATDNVAELDEFNNKLSIKLNFNRFLKSVLHLFFQTQ